MLYRSDLIREFEEEMEEYEYEYGDKEEEMLDDFCMFLIRKGIEIKE